MGSRALLLNFTKLQSFVRCFSSKTPINSNLVAVSPSSSAVQDAADAGSVSVEVPSDPVPIFSGLDIREMNQEQTVKVHKLSQQVCAAQAKSLVENQRPRKRKPILIMPEEDYADRAILRKRPPLLDRRGEGESYFFKNMAPDNWNGTDLLCAVQADIDLRPEAIKRWYETKTLEGEIIEQRWNPKRQQILGNDLAAAHVVLARGGKVKFMGQKTWITDYRKDAKPGVPEEDLPVMKFELCTLPVNYDPRWRLEGMDASKVRLHYEGLANFEGLRYVKWLSLRESPFLDDWGLERLARQLGETLEWLDLSGCKGLSDRGIGALHRCSNLKVLVLEDMGHLEDNLEIVCALLEEHNPELEIVGIDYQAKTEELRLEGERLEEEARRLEGEKRKDLHLISSSEQPVTTVH